MAKAIIMQQVDAVTRKALRKRFSGLLGESKESLNKRGYDLFVISCYSHWLTEEEAETQILSFAIFEQGDVKLDEYFEKEKEFIFFYTQLYSIYSILLTFNREVKRFFIPSSLDEYIQACKKSLREQNFVNVCIPEKNIILLGGFDLNIVCYYPIGTDMEDIKNMAVKNNLFILL